MMKCEFEGRIGQTVDDIFYQRVEIIYMYHPFIRNVEGKDQIAQLYKQGILMDLYPKARQIKSIEDIISMQKEYLDELYIEEARKDRILASIKHQQEYLETISKPNSLV